MTKKHSFNYIPNHGEECKQMFTLNFALFLFKISCHCPYTIKSFTNKVFNITLSFIVKDFIA